MSDILWSDPQPFPGRGPSKRGVGQSFGPDITAAFLDANGLQLLIRSHEVKEEGYVVEHGGRCVTVFSAPNYCDRRVPAGRIAAARAPRRGCARARLSMPASHSVAPPLLPPCSCGNKGAVCRLPRGRMGTPTFLTFSERPHPPVKPMAVRWRRFPLPPRAPRPRLTPHPRRPAVRRGRSRHVWAVARGH